LTWRIHGVFIAHESYPFMKMRGCSVILHLWYFKLYYTQNNTYWINIKYWGTVWSPKKITCEYWARACCALHGFKLPHPSQGSLGSLLYFGLRIPSRSSRGVLVGLILGELFLSILRGILGTFYLNLLGTST
jgi:hypothetical protein